MFRKCIVGQSMLAVIGLFVMLIAATVMSAQAPVHTKIPPEIKAADTSSAPVTFKSSTQRNKPW